MRTSHALEVLRRLLVQEVSLRVRRVSRTVISEHWQRIDGRSWRILDILDCPWDSPFAYTRYVSDHSHLRHVTQSLGIE